ncbi:hypothetical protein ABGB12_13570 [Actinocorallia sp. B10E7]|uniref:hypothetical protein n=1 Tax=Actinocorallia sp. B10E7 TaxID=3153558 RepID=UPI00325EF0BB
MIGRRRAALFGPLAGLALLALYGYGRLLLPRLARYGASRAEAGARLPGDELIPDGVVSTMAVTLQAPPERVWAWLARPDLKVGARAAPQPGGDPHFTVEVLDAPHTLVLSSDQRPSRGRMTVPEGPLPPVYRTTVRGFHLRALPGGRTRLVVRTRSEGRPRAVVWLADFLFNRPASFLRQLRQFQELAALAEAKEETGAGPVDEGPADARPSASARGV